MAYRLQTAREPMELRLAIVAESKAVLLDKLKTYLAKPKQDLIEKGIFTGDVLATKKDYKTTLLTQGKAKALLLESALQERNLEQLALLWVTGADIAWQKLYQNQSVRLISLPGYPFAKERYWA